MKKVYIENYGNMEIVPWDEIRRRDIRYVCTDNDEGYDVFEVEEEQADDFGALYATNIQ